MAIQEEKAIFPHVVPPAPDKSGDFRKDIDTLFAHITDTNLSLTELNRQIVDKYNMHVVGSHAHPGAWKVMKTRRPSYENSTDGGTTITVPASSTNPGYFVIGEARQVTPSKGFTTLEFTSDLTCDLSGSGVGGLDTGAIAANTPYYLYGVNNSSAAGLIASASDPDTGPSGYTYGEWNYIGAVATDSGAATFNPFKSTNGVLITDDEIESETHTGDTSATSKTFASMPTTITHAWIRGNLDGATANASGRINGASGATNNALLLNMSTANNSIHTIGWVSIFTSQTLYLTTGNSGNTVSASLQGWREDSTRWP